MVTELLLGFIGAAILLVTSKMGITLSLKFGSRGLPIILGTVALQFILVGLYATMVLLSGVDDLMFGLGLGFGIFLDVGYKIYLAYLTKLVV